MLQKLKSIILTASVALTLATPLAVTAVAGAADVAGNLCGGANLSTSANSTGCTKSTSDFSVVLATIINLFSLVVGIVAVVMIIIAGFKYITSGGDSTKVTSAKGTIIQAVIGLVVVAFAQAIVQFVLNNAK